MGLRHDRRRAAGRLVAAAVVAVLASAASAADGKIGVELNKVEDQSGGCRLYFVLDNATASAFEVYKLDLVMFGTDGVIARRLAVEVGPLRPAKTSVKLFDVAGLPCAGIGTALVNDVLSCKVGADERPNCIDLIQVASRAKITLTK
jgi:hypothetical protein